MTGIGFASGRIAALFALLTVAPLLSACGHDSKSPTTGSAAADAQSELRREQDCANPQWKAANPGLYYNLCPNDPLR